MSPKSITGVELELDDGPCARGGAVPRRREQPRVPRVLRAPGGAPDHRRSAYERAARLHEHALQAPRGLRPEGRRGRVGHAPRAPCRDRGGCRGRLQGRAQADARPAAGAVPALSPDRRGLRLQQPRVRGVGGRRRDRDAGDPGGRCGHPHRRGLDRPGRLPALLAEREPDDDAARRLRRPGLHAGARRAAVRRPPGPGPRLHRPEGRHLGQHPRSPRHRRQDRRTADRAVRVARDRDRARVGALTRPVEGDRRARRAGARVEGPRDDAARPRPRSRADRSSSPAHPTARRSRRSSAGSSSARS